MSKRITHRSEKEGLIDHLNSLIEAGVVPSSLQSAKESLMKKIQAEAERFNESFVSNSDVFKMPSMGVLKVTHEQIGEHKSLFGTDIKTCHQTRIQLYEAYQLKSDGSIFADKLIDEIVMSEKQFADLLVNTNRGPGYPVTVETLNGSPVAEYDPELDPSKRSMKNLGDRLRKNSAQTTEFLDQVMSILSSAELKGKMGKRDAAEIVDKMTMIPNYLNGNSDYDLSLLNKEMSKRANEVTLNVHFSVNHLANN